MDLVNKWYLQYGNVIDCYLKDMFAVIVVEIEDYHLDEMTSYFDLLENEMS
jgi:hypothetical protein